MFALSILQNEQLVVGMLHLIMNLFSFLDQQTFLQVYPQLQKDLEVSTLSPFQKDTFIFFANESLPLPAMDLSEIYLDHQIWCPCK